MRSFLAVVLLMIAASVNAQITTSTLSGKVVAANGEAIIGATVQATHTPSGTHYGTVTNMDGLYTIQGMRTGGPYTVEISYIGYQTVNYPDVNLSLGEVYNLNTTLKESSEVLDEVVVVATRSKFSNEKTGASTNISNAQMVSVPTVNRSISDIARLSPYANGMSFAGGDGRSTNFTVDGANFNNNFGLSSALPGGGNPISMDAIEEVQVVVAPFDVRQTNFIGGGINAVTKSGTNTFKGTAYYYYRDQDLRGNKIDGVSLGDRTKESKKTFGFTLGGPIIKNKLFFFVNYENEKTPGQVINYRAANDGETGGKGNVSRTKASDLQKVSDFVKSKYGYDTGSFTNFPGDESNYKFLARLDWNITDRHHLSVRYNNTKNTAWNAPNGNSSDTGYRLNNTYRVGLQSMSYANSMYSMDNKVQSISVDLNSRFNDKISNQLLFTYTNIEDIRGSKSSIFPFIDIMAGKDSEGNQLMEPYISLGYELFTYNNGVKNKITNVTDNFTYLIGAHKITAGASYEHQFANNAYMRNGTGYYRYNSVEDFLNQATPESFAITYGFNGVSAPNAQVAFNQIGFYAQDEWNISPKFKLTYGVRFDDLIFDNKDIARNTAIYDLSFRNGQKIDTGKWPSSRLQISPRIGYTWDVFGDKTLKFRGGTGIFTGRLPLVFFTNMPTNANMVQNSVQFKSDYKNGVPTGSYDSRLDQFKGNMLVDTQEMINKFNLPTSLDKHYAGSKISGVDKKFKMPQVWKTSFAVDYQIPVSFPLTVTGEFMFTKNVNAVSIDNINIKNPSEWLYYSGSSNDIVKTGVERFGGADNRIMYPTHTVVDGDKKTTYYDYLYYGGKNAVVLTNTHKGWGYTANITVNAQPVQNMNAMLAYTHTESKEVSGLPGSDPISTWQGLNTIDGPNFGTVQRSQYVIPDKIIASVTYDLPFEFKGFISGVGSHASLFYTGYSYGGYSWMYTNDMNGDGISNDLMYIPKNDSEIQFKEEADRIAFWKFVNQDSYLKHHKGEYAEAYAARSPWVHRFDFRFAQDLELKIGSTKHKFQISADIMNVGNILNSKWGVYKNNAASNYSRILKFEGKDANNVPIYSMYKDKNGSYPTESYSTYVDYSQCWKIQLGLKYFFN